MGRVKPTAISQTKVRNLANGNKIEATEKTIFTTDSSANEYKDIVKEGYDLAILINQLDDSTLIMWRISTGRLKLFANTTYLKTAGEPKAIADLTSHTLLCMAHRQNEVT